MCGYGDWFAPWNWASMGEGEREIDGWYAMGDDEWGALSLIAGNNGGGMWVECDHLLDFVRLSWAALSVSDRLQQF